MVTLHNKQILINGKPKLILCGEIHYFRLPRTAWQDRIDKLKEAGFNAVASYIPWICHEQEEGCFDFGEKRSELDLVAFIELCQQNDLYFIARPGPFIMAEMKNEGIPYWVAQNHKEVVPVTWDGAKVPTKTLDYLSESFLVCVKRWYEKVCAILSPHLEPKGGNVIAFQLDNEMGMLSWVSNCPDLTEWVMKDMEGWLKKQYKDNLGQRYPLFNDTPMKEFFQSPNEETSLLFHQDLGNYMRERICRYTEILKQYAEEFGIRDILFLINIHGTGGGRGLTYPIGISQLYRAYTKIDGILAGSDIYLGTLSMQNFQDLYLINTYMEAVNRLEQPLASFEFECGDSDYGETKGGRNDVSASDLKTRMCIMQGNRLLNCYLFCGGYNYLLDKDYKDGNNRIAFTGERHGFAAPVGPEGKLNYTYPRLKRVMKTMAAMEDKLVEMEEIRDSLSVGFLPDYYMTEFSYPKSASAKKQKEELQRCRAGNGFEVVTRAMLLNNYCFTSVNIEENKIPSEIKTLVVYSAPYMSKQAQNNLADFVQTGGGLLLYGLLPEMDMEGNSCTILKDLMGITKTEIENSEAEYWLSVKYLDVFSNLAEIRTGRAQTYEFQNGISLFQTADTKKICGLEQNINKGKIIIIGAELTCNLEVFKTLLERLGSTSNLSHNCEEHGIVLSMTKDKKEEKLLHILNLDTFEKEAILSFKDTPLFEGRQLRIPAGEGMMLPIDLTIDEKHLLFSTAEIYERTKEYWILRLTQEEDVLIFSGIDLIQKQDDYKIEEQEGITKVISCKNGKVNEYLKLYFKNCDK